MSSLYPIKKKEPETYTTEFDILKASHKFLRNDEEDMPKSWDAQLAKKYEDSLFKEFVVCNLKHYRSGNIALRWRTENEVLSGAGETSCGNTRCPYYDTSPSGSQDTCLKPPKPPRLTTMELPFSYVERCETRVREVMVKVVLCERCVKKLMWKREMEKIKQQTADLDTKALQTREALDFHGTGSSSRKRGRNESNRVQENRRSRSISPHRRNLHHRVIIPHVQ